ncbi:MAG TPA: protein kinase [Gemmatimonadales bacterium]|nr:protein kinase [Gemmatimonadales bacterium]
MPLATGARLGPYEVTGTLGAGGMGEVYRATDTSLGRSVALKVLPEAVAHDADRLARFEREARTLAALNHPNIAAVYGLEKSSGVHALVMELVDGPTLADRVVHGAIPLDEALAIAKQIAEALEAAHEQGIVHRDLKPANVKVRPDGTVKVLDFGLAKASDPRGSSPVPPSSAVATAMTDTGIILGTAPYMSPEQACGKAVDKRTDIWAFGCVLYEMLTGRATFSGDSTPATLIAIVEREPEWAALPPATPASVRRLLERCLVKDPKLRLRDVGDARADLIEGPPSPPSQSPPRASRLRAAVQWVLVPALTAAAAALLVWYVEPASPSPGSSAGAIARLVITAPPGEPLATDTVGVAISPDGRRVAYVAGRGNRRIYLRDIDQFDSIPLPGTEGANSAFFSPDGESIGFVAGGRMKRVRVAGGSPQTITETVQTASAFTASWESDDTIFFTPVPGTGIWRVPATTGGSPTALTKLTETESTHRWPQLLPGGKALLFSAAGTSGSQSYVQLLETGARRPLVKGEGTRYLPTGHLVYTQGGTLVAVPFDPERLEITGPPFTAFSGVLQMNRLRNSTVTNLVPQIAFSNAGSVAYVPASRRPPQHALVWVNRTGVEQPTGAYGGVYYQPRISPDGRRVAVTIGGEDFDDVWVYDLTRHSWSRFTTTGGNNAFPLWAPEGDRLTYVSDRAGPDNMYSKPLDDSGPERRLAVSDTANYPFGWSKDGTLVFVATDPGTLQDIWVLRPGEGAKPEPLVRTRYGEGAPAISPDGRWLAYASNESGRNEVYVRPFQGPGERSTVSIDGGNEPVWSPTGRELFFRNGDAMMAVDVSAGPSFAASKPRLLFEKHYQASQALWPNYAVAPDGRFVMVKALDQEGGPTQINVVVNWFDELKRLATPK